MCTLAQVQSNQIGTAIITSSNVKESWIDITTNYCENHTHSHPQIHSPSSPYPYPPPSRDCHIELDCRHVTVGKDFDITITLHNDGPMIRTIDGKVIVMSIQYTGKCAKYFISMQFEGAITPQKSEFQIICY